MGDGECDRCGRETDTLTLDGRAICLVCQDKLEEETTTRDVDQASLEDAGGDHVTK
jgi:hypothetical protein